MNQLQNLIKKAKSATSVTLLPFMDGKEKGEMVLNTIVHIDNYGFLTGKNEMTGKEEEYICYTIQEDETKFYFGGSVLTDMFHKLEDELGSDIQLLLNEGIEVTFSKVKSKNNRQYVKPTLFPSFTEEQPF